MNTLIFKKIIAVSLSLCIFLPSVSLAQNSINTSAGNVTTDGSSATGVGKAQNGVPLVNIANPSGAGVSHNKFSEFNVGAEGIIMNNNSQLGTSLLGGAMTANPNFTPGNQGARVILNEVTSTNASRLLGATEVHGRSAEYILANPNGITCNGCEFINTPRVMLGTGRPDMQNGEFKGLHIDPAGQINIEGHGLNATNVDYFDIVTRAAKINAQIYTNELNLKLGNQYYDENTHKIKSSNVHELTAPTLSLDSSQLGGIQAGRITLESTELGVGVNSSGGLTSNQNMIVTADGKIVYENAVSKTGSVVIHSKNSGIEQKGFTAAKDVSLTANGKVTLNGGSDQIGNSGIYAEGNVWVNSHGAGAGIENNTRVTSLGKTTLNTSGEFSNASEIYSSKDIHVDAASIQSKDSSTLFSLEDIQLNSTGNTDLGGDIYSKTAVNIDVKGNLTNTSAIESEDIQISGDSVDLTGQSSLFSHGDLAIKAERQANLAGDKILAQGGIAVKSEGDVINQTFIQSAGELSVTAVNDISNTGTLMSGSIENTENALINLQAQNMTNTGDILSYGDAFVDADNNVTLTAGDVVSSKNITINSGNNITNHTQVQADKNIEMTAANNITNGGSITGGTQEASGDVSLASKELHNNSAGKLLSFGELDITTEDDLSLNGRVETVGNMKLSAQGNITVHSDVVSNEDMVVNAKGSLTNHGSLSAGNTLGSATGLSLNFDTLTNNGGLLSNRNLSMTSASDLNLTGRIMSYGDMNITSAGNATNRTILDSGSSLTMNVLGDFNNGYLNGTQSVLADVISNNNTNINATNITNYGSIMAGGDLSLSSKSQFLNDRRQSAQGFSGNALLLSGGNMHLYSDKITNSSGEIFSMGNITLQGKENGDASSEINNISGMVDGTLSSAIIEADQNITIRSDQLNNRSYDHGHSYVDFHIRVGDPGNEGLSLVYEDQVHSDLKSEPAFITAGNDLNITGNVLNHASSLSAGNDITINGGSVNNEDRRVDYHNLERVYMNRHYTGNGEHVIYEDTRKFDTNAVSNFRPMIYAARNLTIDGSNEVSNGLKADPHAKVLSTANLDSVRKTGVIPTLGITALTLSGPLSPTAPVSLNQNSLFNLSALFQFSDLSSRYLIESRTQFMKLPVDFRGSDHFLTRTGFRTDTRLLGDDRYMAMLVERSILEATGLRYLEKGVGSNLEQLERLYNNAFEEGKDHELSVGKTLSSDQIADLKKDIVWLVEVVIEVNGKSQKVLVPQVYLARATRESLENPEALMEGKFVSIKSEGNIENYGKIYGHDSLYLSSEQNIKNHKSEMLTDGVMHLWAGGDLLNDAGRIFAGKDMLLDAKGSITSNNVIQREGHQENWKDKHLYMGSIESAGTAVLSAGKDINILGTSLKAGGGLGLAAGNNVNIKADRLDSHKHILMTTDGGSHESLQDTTRHHTANVSAGQDMQIASGKDINIIGAEVSSGDNMALEAGNEITVASVADRDYSTTRDYSSNRMSSEETISAKNSIKNQSSNLKSGGNFLSLSGGDSNIIASNISAEGRGTLIVGSKLNKSGEIVHNKDAELNILSATDSDSAYFYHKKVKNDIAAAALGTAAGSISGGPTGAVNGFKLGAKAQKGEIREDESFHTREVESNLNFGGDARLVSAGDINIVSSKISSKNNIKVLAGQGLQNDGSFKAVNANGKLFVGTKGEIHQERHSVEKIRPDYIGVAGGSALGGVISMTGNVIMGPVGGIAGAKIAGDFLEKTGEQIANKRDKSSVETHEILRKASSLSSGNDMALSAEKEIIVSASNLNSGRDMALESKGEITLTSEEELLNHKESKSHIKFDMVNMKVNRSSIDLNLTQEGKENTKETERVTQKQSNLTAGGNINIHSGGDTNIVSSNLLANDKVSIKSEKDINFLTAENKENVTESENTLRNTFTLSGGNAWVESGYAAHDSASMLKEFSEADNSGSTNGKINTAVASAKAAMAGYQIAKTIEAVAGAVQTGGTYGFHSRMSVSQEIDRKSSSKNKSSELGSSILAKNIDIDANSDIKARGINLNAEGGDIHLKAGDDISIESAENKAGSSSSREYRKLETTIMSSNGNFIPSSTVSSSKSSGQEVTQANSQITANQGTVKIETGGNTDLVGVNVKGKHIDMTGIEGDLTLASKQDRSESSSSHYSLELGRENVGFSIGESNASENWTNSQSSIIGTDSVQIKAKNLNLAGSVIANQKEDGTDGGNLTVNVEQLNYTDLKDTSESDSYSFSIGTTRSGPIKGENKKKDRKWKEGSTSVSFSNGGHEKEGFSHATLGNGAINIEKSPKSLDNINRDLSETQIVTKDKKTGGLDTNLTISNEFIADVVTEGALDASGKHLKIAGKTMKDLPKNIVKAGKRMGDVSSDVFQAVENLFTEGVNPFKDYQTSIKFRQATLDFQRENSELTKVLNNKQAKGTTEYKKALQKYVNYVSAEIGRDPINLNLYAEKDKYQGKSDKNSQNILINVVNTNLGDTEETLDVLGHEIGHQIFKGKGEKYGDLSSEKMLNAWDSENDFKGFEIGEVQSHVMPQTYADQLDIVLGNDINTGLTSFYEKISYKGYSKKEMKKILKIVKNIRKTKHGDKLLSDAENDKKRDIKITNTNKSPSFLPSKDKINFNLKFKVKIDTKKGKIPASLERILAHELGHAVTGTKDDGKNHMNNVIQNENPVATELGQPARTKY